MNLRLRLIILFSFSSLLSHWALGQSQDSLLISWENEALEDSARIHSYRTYIASHLVNTDLKAAFKAADELMEFGKKHENVNAQIAAWNITGQLHQNQTDFPEAIHDSRKALKMADSVGNADESFIALNNLGRVFEDMGNLNRSIELRTKSLRIAKEMGDLQMIAESEYNIGRIYSSETQNFRSLEYYNRSLRQYEELGDELGIAKCLNAIGWAYQIEEEYDKALDFNERGLALNLKLDYKRGIGASYNNFGRIYLMLNDLDKSLEYNFKSLEVKRSIGFQLGIARSFKNIGRVYLAQKSYGLAIEYCKKSYDLTIELQSINDQKLACNCLYKAYKGADDTRNALLYYEKSNELARTQALEEAATKLEHMEFQKLWSADSLATFEKEALIELAHAAEIKRNRRIRNIILYSSILLLLLAIVAYVRWRHLSKLNRIISKEKERSENLLLNILPAEIAEELKEKGEADARDFELASILFTDFKGFTLASERLSAADLVAEINTCFKVFDAIVGHYKIEKIKTIGDAYMCAGGLPIPDDKSVENTVRAGIEMQAFMNARKKERDATGLPVFEMRVGIHTGPVVAGIVGVKKFQYDIWGDTVNTASRMESSGTVGQVNISQSTYALLKDHPAFKFESRGKISAKGKGEMEMWFVSLKS